MKQYLQIMLATIKTFHYNLNNTNNYYFAIMATKEFRDPVHGFVHVDESELNIIEEDIFQRLRHIKQLALLYFVYPGVTHTRFEHSLGTMHLSSKLFDFLCKKPETRTVLEELCDKNIEKYRRLVRIAALIHDIGHLPFSHVSENILYPEEHEKFGKEMIYKTSLKDILEKNYSKYDISVDEISFVALGKPEQDAKGKDLSQDELINILHQIIAGDFGVDRIDYLLRDSLHAGVFYGHFDYHRLLETFTILKDPRYEFNTLGLEVGGLHAAEGLIFARYFMFHQLYYHKTRRIYDEHLKRYLKAYTEKKEKKFSIKELIELTDDYFLHEMIKDCNSPHSEVGKQADRILNRNHFREAYYLDTSNLPDRLYSREKIPEREVKECLGEIKKVMDSDLGEIEKVEEIRRTISKQISPIQIIDEIKKAVSEEFDSQSIIFDRTIESKEFESILDEPFYVVDKNAVDEKVKEITKLSPPIENLKNIDLFRVYCDKEVYDKDKGKIYKICDDIVKNYQKKVRI